MYFSSEHMQWLVDTEERVNTADGKEVKIFEFQHVENETILKSWAKHFRNHYCLDDQIDQLRSGTKLSRTEYLNQIIFPDESVSPGPSIRAGDFAEILVADYLEYILKHWVPRNKYLSKFNKNESVKGVDTIGFLFTEDSNDSPNDKLTMIESKAKYTNNHENKLQDAIDHSNKDVLRIAVSLNAIKQKFLNEKDEEKVKRVERFQDEMDRPYIKQFGAVAHLDNCNFNNDVITSANSSEHSHNPQLFLLIIKGKKMMSLVHELYRRAADEA